MALVVYNTLTREKEPLTARNGQLNVYVCGPTVYDHCHIGHGRSYVSFDVIVRYLRYSGYSVTYVSNITDIDDKIINRANETGRDPADIAKEFTDSYLADMRTLNVRDADHYPKATEFIPQMIELVKTLIEKGYAYESGNDVYFEIEKAQEKVGILSHQKLDQMRPGARIDIEENKRNPLDFTLWKGSKPGEPKWPSPWGEGRPGWHLECTVMSRHYFGDDLDLHGGGMDLIFPHHESEIIQGECATGHVPFSRYWVHNGFLTINNEKMSKSLGNFFTVRQVLDKFPARAIRFYILNTHYRRPIDFSDAHIQEARTALERLTNAMDNLKFALKDAPDTGNDDDALIKEVDAAVARFKGSMDDDFNTRDAIAALYPLAKKINELITSKTVGRPSLEHAYKELKAIDGILGVLEPFDKKAGALSDSDIDALITERDEARASKDWKRADEIRDQLKDAGIMLEDGKDGSRWKRA